MSVRVINTAQQMPAGRPVGRLSSRRRATQSQQSELGFLGINTKGGFLGTGFLSGDHPSGGFEDWSGQLPELGDGAPETPFTSDPATTLDPGGSSGPSVATVRANYEDELAEQQQEFQDQLAEQQADFQEQFQQTQDQFQAAQEQSQQTQQQLQQQLQQQQVLQQQQAQKQQKMLMYAGGGAAALGALYLLTQGD